MIINVLVLLTTVDTVRREAITRWFSVKTGITHAVRMFFDFRKVVKQCIFQIWKNSESRNPEKHFAEQQD